MKAPQCFSSPVQTEGRQSASGVLTHSVNEGGRLCVQKGALEVIGTGGL